MQNDPLRIGAIVAMTKTRVIGLDGGLPWHYSDDLKRFKKITIGSVIIMGRKTWDSINHNQLPGRRSIVISRNPVTDVEHYSDIAVAIKKYPTQRIWIIGGGEIYRLGMPYINLIDVTTVPDKVQSKDAVTFPAIDPKIWQAEQSRKISGDDNLIYTIYKRYHPV